MSPDTPTSHGAELPPLASILTPAELKALGTDSTWTIEDLLLDIPFRYIVPGPVRQLDALRDGDDVSLFVDVVSVTDRPMQRRKGNLLLCVVSDGTDQLTLTFFLPHQGMVAWHRQSLVPGARIVVLGTVSVRTPRHGELERQITHPRYTVVDEGDESSAAALHPVPVYSAHGKAKQNHLRGAHRSALLYADSVPSALPEHVRRTEGLPTLGEALRSVHAPKEVQEAHRAKRTLILEEAMILQTIFARRRSLDAVTPAPPLIAGGPLQRSVEERLPFTLTSGQSDIGETLAEHLGRPHPANVLLQGDVGSGKTVVALRAMLQAVDSGHQAVLLAPTEVLAEQHHRTITGLLGDLGRAGQLDAAQGATAVRLLTGSRRTADRQRALLDMTTGTAGIIIGTHALLTETIDFASLALVIIDEQHRFGVDHRRRLRSKGSDGRSPHVIVMTATPIPRTAALATVGDLDVLSLRDAPQGRPGVTSYVVHEELGSWESRMWSRAAEEIASGRQVFVVCPRITEDASPPPPVEDPDGGEPLQPPRGVVETAGRLAARPELEGARIGVLHGRQSAEEKQRTMAAVTAGEIDLLVATTVIEVGVDVPNASVMIVLDAERFGVSQLHQLRGRVGRAEHPGLAFLDTRASIGSGVTEHLEQIAATTDGFALAELDLRHRGGGDLIGEEQSGLRRTLRFLDIVRDLPVIERAREHALALVAEDPELAAHPALRDAVERRLADADPNVERS